MMSATGTLMIDTFATGHYNRQHFSSKPNKQPVDEEMTDEHAGHVHVHTHATHGHAHGSTDSSSQELDQSKLNGKHVISQVIINDARILISGFGVGNCGSLSNNWNIFGCFGES